MHQNDIDLASFLERQGDEPVVLWYASSTSGDPRDAPRARFDFTLVQALLHLRRNPDIYAFDIDLARGDKMRLGPERVNALMELVSEEVDDGDVVQPTSR
jgi:hypothetical protein